MLANRWQAFSPVLQELQQFPGDVHRLFNNWLRSETGMPGPEFPLINICEEGDHVYVEAELPGLDPTSLEVLVAEGNQLTLKGERKKPAPEKGIWHRQERGVGVFVRTLTLPVMVDADHVEARMENGVLYVTLAKHETTKPRKIAIKAK